MADKATIRPVAWADYPAIQALLRQARWPQRSLAGWDWVWQQNPARQALLAQHEATESDTVTAPLGWVIVNEGDGDKPIVGYLGNIQQQFYLHDPTPGPTNATGWHTLATCTSYYVDPAWRAKSIGLMRPFFLQKGISAAFSTTANAHSATVYELYKAQALHDPGYRQTVLWLGDETRLCRKGLRKSLLPLLGATLLERCRPLIAQIAKPLGYALRLLRPLLGATPPRLAYGGDVKLCAITEVDSRFDSLWQKMIARPGLWLDRRAATWRWRLQDPDQQGQLALYAAINQQNQLDGYLVLARYTCKTNLQPRAYLLDFVLDPTLPTNMGAATSAALLHAAVADCRQHSLVVLEAQRFSHASDLFRYPHGGYLRSMAQTHTSSHYLRLLKPAGNATTGLQAATSHGWSITAIEGDFWYGLTAFGQEVSPSVAPLEMRSGD
ncbi:hypothetical protein [Parvibium lacunae]|uniref:Uncharacterized protein n=1 Tax=Parvibium lacunae TaxID=1888893 RepID=A0A368L0D9_9BURK|nr:hypothetical protein [Parvibium lacunae]RCS57019.1 hypothetical protein DU000_09435 [Parvibium lacunae]